MVIERAPFSILAATGVPAVIGWSLVLIAVVIVGFLVVIRLRQWLQADDEPVAAGFSISDLKRLHKEGKISTEEFERARQKMVGAAKAMTEKLPDPLAGSRKRADERPRTGGDNPSP